MTIIRKRNKEDSCTGKFYVNGSYMCATLEPHAIDWDTEEKTWGKTAIPVGSYDVTKGWSKKFSRFLPYVNGVPEFTGIMIHPGNTPKDTQGCILLGEMLVTKTILVNSTTYVNTLMSIIDTLGGPITLTIIEEF